MITRGFYFETFISKKKILLIHTSPEGFHPVYEIQYSLTIDIFPEGNDYPSAEGLFAMYQNLDFILKDLFHRRKFI